MASTDATPLPIKNQAYRVTFPIFDADGDLVPGAAGLDSERSLDAAAFADCINEAIEIAAASGMYYLDLTAAEMNADTVAIIVKTTTSGAKTTPIVLYPAEDTDIPVNVTAVSGDTVAADNLETAFDGGAYNVGGGAIIAASVTGNIGGNLAGSVGSVVGAVGSVIGNVGGNIVGTVASVVGNVGGNVVGNVNGTVGSVVGNIGGNVVGTVASVVGNVGGNLVGSVNGNVDGSVASVTGNIGGNVVGSVGSVIGAVGSVTGNLGGSVVGNVQGDVQGNVDGSVASVTGAVGSVTGAVGSVTGNVGGNVTGSVGSVIGNVGGNVVGTVASVVGAVGSVTGNVGGNVTGTVGSVVGNLGGNVVGNVNGNVVGSVGSVLGAVGSVTGAVGSVTGNVGGNVVGSVGSVVGDTPQTGDNFPRIGLTGAGLTTVPWNPAWDAEVESEVIDALVAQRLDHLVAVADADDPVDDSIIAKMAASDGDWSGFSEATDSLEAIRDRGDAAWITGGGGAITEILNVQPLIPNSIDLANAATFRLGIMLINSLDDLPTIAEIDPGTIDIHRKAAGGAAWVVVVNGAACSELAGLVYYDEVFDAGSGYAEDDSIRITFKGQKITVAANDHEISDANGRMFYTEIRGGGASAADVWSYSPRTLTESAASAADAITGAAITRTRCTTWSISISGVGNIAARTQFYFTIKRGTSDGDDEALVKIEETAGLQVINGSDTGVTPGNGAIVVTDAVAGDFTVTLAAIETCELTEEDGLFYDAKQVLAASVPTPVTTGRFNIASIVTGAIT